MIQEFLQQLSPDPCLVFSLQIRPFWFQEFKNEVLIPTNIENAYFLGPMGDPDPTELINLQTNRLPFKKSTMSPSVWDKTFNPWSLPLDGWRDWYLRVAKTHQARWVTYDLDQCIAFSLEYKEE